EALARHVNGDQGGRASRLHRDTRALEVQLVGDAGGQEILVVTDQDLHLVYRRGQIRPREEIRKIVADPGASVEPDRSGVALRIVAGILERFPGALEEDPLLGIDGLGLAG